MTNAGVGAPAVEARDRSLPRAEIVYVTLATSFVGTLLLTNVIGTKLFSLPLDLPIVGPLLSLVDRLVAAIFGGGGGDALTLTAGIITYPATFFFTDVVSEVYGRRRADLMVGLGFAASLLMLAIVSLARALPAAPIWNVPAEFAGAFAPERLLESGAADALAAQAAYQFTFDAPGTLLLASMTAYLVAQLVDVRLFHFWRRVTGAKWLWFRNNASTGISQLIDTIIVNTIFLKIYWELPWAAIGGIIVSAYVVKVIMALLDTPFCYAGVAIARRLNGTERE